MAASADVAPYGACLICPPESHGFAVGYRMTPALRAFYRSQPVQAYRTFCIDLYYRGLLVSYD